MKAIVIGDVVGKPGRRVLTARLKELRGMPVRFETATGDARLSGVVVEIDEHTGRARGIERFQVREE